SATAASDGTDSLSTVGAEAASGASGKVSIAGSVAIAVVDHETLAAVYGTLTLNSGDLNVTSGSELAVEVKALPVGAGSSGTGSVGLGLSCALAVVDASTRSTVEDGVAISQAGDVTIAATSDTTSTVEASMGAALSDGGSG